MTLREFLLLLDRQEAAEQLADYHASKIAATIYNANRGKGRAKSARDFMSNPPVKGGAEPQSLIDQLDAYAAGGGLNNKAEEAIQQANKQQHG